MTKIFSSVFIGFFALSAHTLALAGCDPDSTLKSFLATNAPKGSGNVMISVGGIRKTESSPTTYQYTFQNNSDNGNGGTYGGYIALNADCKVVDSSLMRLEPLKP